MNKSVLLTGGAGYIGSHVAKELHKNGYTPVILDTNIKDKPWCDSFGPAFDCLLPKEIIFLKDIVHRYNIDSCIHLAADAKVGESVINPSKYYMNNVTMTLSLINNLKDIGINKFVFSSSAAVYGTLTDTTANENDVPMPINAYGKSKYFVEEILKDYSVAYNFKSISLRYFNVSGINGDLDVNDVKNDTEHLIPIVIHSARNSKEFTLYGTDFNTPDGTCVRDYVHINDVAEAHVLALQSLDKDYVCEQYNIGSGVGTSNLEIVKKIERYYGPMKILKTDKRPGDPAVLVANIDKVKADLNWKPTHSSVDNIIGSVIQWYNNINKKDLN
jgi:UDP-glucose 4-epimerase